MALEDTEDEAILRSEYQDPMDVCFDIKDTQPIVTVEQTTLAKLQWRKSRRKILIGAISLVAGLAGLAVIIFLVVHFVGG